MELKKLKLTEIKPYGKNPRKNDGAVDAVAESIKQCGYCSPIVVDENYEVLAGHTRLKALKKLGRKECEVVVKEGLTEEQKQKYRILDNKTGEFAEWDLDVLQEQLKDLDFEGFDFGFADIGEMIDTGEEELIGGGENPSLNQVFIVPPFSVLDTKQGYWVDRKRMWKNLGLKSEIGRGNDGDKTKGGLIFASSAQPVSTYKSKEKYEKKIGKTISWKEFAELFPEEMKQNGTSVFDPVLCEIMYKWFCVDGGTILDPFAGGSVRGIVAKKCGYEYFGNDLSERQIQANKNNAEEIFGDTKGINWSVGDSCDIDNIIQKRNFDCVFTCPPYADLEVYSNNEKDISNMDYPNFLKAYETILSKSIGMLGNDRFCIVVVGDVRDKKGIYRNLISETKNICIKAGAKLYNEFILLDQIGSAAMRAAKQFNASRKNCKIHQNVLVFYKGDTKNISKNFKPIDFSGIEKFDIINETEGD